MRAGDGVLKSYVIKIQNTQRQWSEFVSISDMRSQEHNMFEIQEETLLLGN